MEDAARGRHPLHVAGTDHAAIAGRIPVLDLAVIDDGDRLEPAMGMLADPTARGGRLEIVRPGIVEQQERADLRAERIVGKERADRNPSPTQWPRSLP
jgi:hypothetical protein